MRKIIVGARVSMDGVMQEPMGPSEGFKLGGWARPYQDQDCGEEFDRLFLSEKYDLLAQLAEQALRLPARSAMTTIG
jgi:hypothetical protein